VRRVFGFRFSVFSLGLVVAFRLFEKLDVWKRACQLAVYVYETLKENRDFGLKDQMQRAAVSIASNIAEGAERGGKDFARFLRVARGSAAELRPQAYIASRVEILPKETVNHIVEETKIIARMLTSLANSISTENRKPKTEN